METINMKQARKLYRRTQRAMSFRAWAREGEFMQRAVGKLAAILSACVLFMACAPIDQEIGREAGPVAGASAVESKTEALLASCTNASYCSAQKAFMNSSSGVSWSWSGSCSSSATWFGTASGGRTASATPFSGITGRYFEQSQSWDANVYCSCVGTNNVSCHF